MPDTGPHVQLATFCDKALLERDGVLSVIRAIDRIVIVATGAAVPAELPEGQNVTPTLVVALRSDKATGRHTISIAGEKPDGSRLPQATFDVTFEGAERGVNLILPMVFQPQEGLYWFDVRIGDQLLSRVPLRIIYQRLPGPVLG